MGVKGIDVSYFQGTIDWSKVKESGIEFVIPRSSYGKSTTDSKFYVYVSGAKKAGINVPATYHFSYAYTNTMAANEAKFAVQCAKNAGLPSSTIIFFDFEYDSVEYAKKQGVTVTPSLCISMTKAFCETVEGLGYKSGVYANGDYYKRFYNNGTGIPSTAVFWLADWYGAPDYPCSYHQTSDKGRIKGIAGDVDLDTYFGDTTKVEYKETTDEVVQAVLDGKYGNGDDRKTKLSADGYNYTEVQSKVNEVIKKPSETKTEAKEEPITNEIIKDVILGKYGNGDERKTALTDAGYDYNEVQTAVNKYLANQKPAISPAKSYNKSIAGTYTVTAFALNVRYVPGILTDNNIEKIIKQGEKIQCWGYYTQIGTSKWYFIQQGNLIGYVDSRYIKR